eukprot:365809-Chlamydomonas_euryale.AAC.7
MGGDVSCVGRSVGAGWVARGDCGTRGQSGRLRGTPPPARFEPSPGGREPGQPPPPSARFFLLEPAGVVCKLNPQRHAVAVKRGLYTRTDAD